MHNLFVANAISNKEGWKIPMAMFQMWKAMKQFLVFKKQYLISNKVDNSVEESWSPPR